ncbi:hypothetical protein P7K49_000472 [Saguinus oedipus]|uniref:Uncharacterized protein n=1 Tax=Saguinus oedipus TaxID=9490 RepID=A0ABQ9WBV3_SAGOE|nr:hypothetical protein P7K49_000472 [Saguinus oedipus]
MPASRLRVTPLAQPESASQAESADSQSGSGAFGRHCGARGKTQWGVRPINGLLAGWWDGQSPTPSVE